MQFAACFHPGNFRKALDYYLRGIKISRAIGELYAFQLKNVGLCYANLRDFQEANLYIGKNLEICQPSCSTEDLLAIRQTQGLIALFSKAYQGLKRYFLDSYDLSKAANNKRFLLGDICFLAEIDIDQIRGVPRGLRFT